MEGSELMLDIDIDQNLLSLEMELASTLIPLKSMSQSHLYQLLQHGEVKDFFKDQTIFKLGDYDGAHHYLLHGDVTLCDEHGHHEIVKGGSNLFPLAHAQPRKVTAKATCDCRILKLNSKQLSELLTWSQIAEYLLIDIAYQRDLDEDVEWMSTVLKSNLFFKVPPTNVSTIFDRLTPMLVSAGDVILRQGEVGDGCFFIKEGDAVVTKADPVTGSSIFLANISNGRCFGEDALVNETVRNATVTMKTDGVLMRLEKPDFIRLLKEPEVPETDWQKASAAGALFIDIRTVDEYEVGHIAGAVNIPLNLLRLKTRLIDKEKDYILYCDDGRRSHAATYLLQNLGFNVCTVKDGLAGKGVPPLEWDTSHLLKQGGVVESIAV